MHNVPPDMPFFELEFTCFRTTGVATPLNISLGKTSVQNDKAIMTYHHGTITVPAASEVITSTKVT